MKLHSSLIGAIAILTIASATTTWVRASEPLRQPESVARTAFEYDSYLEPAASPAPSATDAKNTSVADDGATERAIQATTEGPVSAPQPPQPWHLPQPSFCRNNRITIGGWVEQGITFNNLRPADKFNGPNFCNDRDREYQLNQAWLYFDRPTNTEHGGWDLGGHADVVYGTDWRFGQCFGLENRFDSANSFYGLILPQFYADVAYNRLLIRMGHFATNTSLEKVPAPANFFYSHTYLMGGYFDPLLVTGLQGEYKLGDNWTAIGGLNRGWQEFEDPTNSWNFLGGLRWASDDKGRTLSLMIDTGDQIGFAPFPGLGVPVTTQLHTRNNFIAVYTSNLTTRLQYGAQYTIGQERNGSFVVPGQNDNWYGTEQLLTYKLTDKWSAGARYEYVRDEGGTRIAGVGNALLTDRGWDGLPGFTGSFQDVSLGLNYRPNMNIVVRPETRWDMYDGPVNPYGQLPYGNHTRSSQFTFACDLIVTF
jgi:hypothetical protein